MYFAEEPEHIAMLRESMRRFVEHHLPREQVRHWDNVGEARSCGMSQARQRGIAGLGRCDTRTSFLQFGRILRSLRHLTSSLNTRFF